MIRQNIYHSQSVHLTINIYLYFCVLLIVVTLAAQKSLQVFSNTELKKTIDISESGENLRFGKSKAFQNYPSRMHDFLSTENENEGIRNVPEKINNFMTLDEVRTKYLRNFQYQDDKFHNHKSVRFKSSENRRDVSLAVDKSDNEENVSYKSPESQRYFHESTDISDSESLFQPFKYLRNIHTKNKDSVKYESYESIRSPLEKNQWNFMKPNIGNEFVEDILNIVGRAAYKTGIGKLIEKNN